MSNPFHLESTVRKLEEGGSRSCQLPTSRETWDDWGKDTRIQLKEKLGIGEIGGTRARATSLSSRSREGELIETKFMVQAKGRAPIPVYELSLPTTRECSRAIIVLHGHNPSVQYCLGNYPDEETAIRFRARENNYAEVMARSGWRVFAVEQQGFGERQSDSPEYLPNGEIRRSCRDLTFRYMTEGKSLLGERILDVGVVIDWLSSSGIDSIAVAGNSGGGTTSMWAAALDSRIAVAICGSTFSSFQDSIHGPRHCECNYVPGIRQVADMGEIAALIAPRPLCFLQGENDPIFPAGPAREEFCKVDSLYRLLGCTDNRHQLCFHEGEHRWDHDLALSFLRAWFNE